MRDRNLQRRIRRALAHTSETLRVPRGLAESRAVGVHTIHHPTGTICRRGHTLESLAAEIGLIPCQPS